MTTHNPSDEAIIRAMRLTEVYGDDQPNDHLLRMGTAVLRLAQGEPSPLDMILHCPACGVQHIDAPDTEMKEKARRGCGDCFAQDCQWPACMNVWTNPPHRSHLCASCSHTWRPADVPTNGVAAIKTQGKADSAAPTMLPRAYLLYRMQTLVPLLQESRDALCALTEVGRRLHGVSSSLAERMDAAGTYNIADWRAGRRL